jgi:hypothetical protein
MGPLDCFLFEIDKILLDFDVKTKKCNWINKSGNYGLKKRLGNVSDDLVLNSCRLFPFSTKTTLPRVMISEKLWLY